jgi:hypothetical protein
MQWGGIMKVLRYILVPAAVLAFATPASAAVTLLGVFSGTDCSGTGGFPNCWATQTGTAQGPVTDPLGSPAVFKWNANTDGSPGAIEASPVFPSITGVEFTLGLVGDVLSFTYTQGAGDPDLHYFSVKQANGYALYYDAAPITSGSVDLGDLFPNNVGWSHITWFDTGATEAPEPGTWAMMLLGFGAVGGAMRRRRRGNALQIA